MNYYHFLKGTEKFTFQDNKLPYTVQNYWSWAFSDLYNNIYRGILAEYIVAMALKITPPHGNYQRIVWNPYDLLSKSGKRIEIKSSAYLQSWDGDFSKIIFSIAPAQIDNSISHSVSTFQRNSDVYVFCLYTAKTRDVSPLNLDYWDFYILPTSILNEKKPNQKTISINSLKTLNPECVKYNGLYNAVENITI